MKVGRLVVVSMQNPLLKLLDSHWPAIRLSVWLILPAVATQPRGGVRNEAPTIFRPLFGAPLPSEGREHRGHTLRRGPKRQKRSFGSDLPHLPRVGSPERVKIVFEADVRMRMRIRMRMRMRSR